MCDDEVENDANEGEEGEDDEDDDDSSEKKDEDQSDIEHNDANDRWGEQPNVIAITCDHPLSRPKLCDRCF